MSDDQRIHRKFERQKSGGEKSARPLSNVDQPSRSGRPREEKRIALVHDWLNGMRGGEIVFEALLDLYPTAHVFTLVYEPEKLSSRLREKLERTKVHVSWLNRWGLTRKHYRQLLPILPIAVRSLDVYPYDLVISSSHCVAKGVKKHPRAVHVSYIHAPMRYMWDRFDDYFGKGRISFFIRWAALAFRPLLRAWDRFTASSERIDALAANSRFIAERIHRFYHREAQVIYPFAKLERFHHERKPGGFYLMVGAFAPYKRTDLAIEAFARLGLPLKIVGQGQDEVVLRSLKERWNAKNVEFIHAPTNAMIEALYSQCKAFIFPGMEDFGITPLEAMASGAPIIAYGEGGACETVTDQTGILFVPQTVEALSEAVMDIESGKRRFEAEICRKRAQFFTESRFQEEMRALIQSVSERF